MYPSFAQLATPHRSRRNVAAAGAVLVAIAAGCGTAHDPARDHTLVIALAAEPTLLLPPLIDETPGFVVADQILERLADPDSTLDIMHDTAFHPRLAAAWTWAADSMAIAFRLAPNARWHDGRRVTAHDVRFTFDVYADTTIASAAAPLLDNIDSVQVRDDSTAVFWFHRRARLQFFDATYHMRILPRHLLDSLPRRALRGSPFARAPTGTGPFRFSRWRAGQSVELAANERYHGRRAQFDRLVFAIASDPSATLARALAGEVDVAPHIRASDVARVSQSRRLRVRSWPSLSNGLVMLALHDAATPGDAHPLFGDSRVRRALTLALDRARITRGALGETASPARGPLPAPLLHGAFPPLVLLAFDPRHAAALLDSAGWYITGPERIRHRGPRELRFTLLIPTAAVAARRAAILAQEQLRSVGIAMDIDLADPGTLAARLGEHRFDAVLLALDWDPNPLSARQLWGSSAVAHGANFSGYQSAVFDFAIEASAQARDAGATRTFAAQAWAQLVADAPAIWLYDLRQIAAVRASVHSTPGRPDAWWSSLADWSAKTDADSLRPTGVP
ncbi:MAG TPA: peptide ABC transporter substrate-binding protein [Gemmatimonadaceae bacterium]|jgi:peptide/nickel transport system substrate-binding protein